MRTHYPFHNERVLLVDDHDTDDIINAIADNDGKFASDYDQDAEKFWMGDAKATGTFLFNFLKKKVKYNIEPESSQTVRSPGAILGLGHGDCKHYATFINGVCQALKRKGYPIDSRYEFVADEPGKMVHHVFAVIIDGNKEWWCDPVPPIKMFNERPTFYENKQLEPMPVYEISGVTNPITMKPMNLPEVNGIGKKGNFFKDLTHGIVVDARNTGKGIQQAERKVKSLILNVDMAPARNAVLALADLNAFNIAERMAAGNVPGLLQKWQSIGGNPSKLKNAINNGLHHAHSSKHIGDPFNYATVLKQSQYGTPPTMAVPPPMAMMPPPPPPQHINFLASLANTLLGMLESYFGLPHIAPLSNQNIQQAAQAGTHAIVQNAAGNSVPGAGAKYSVTSGIDPMTGQPSLGINNVSSPTLTAAGGANGGAQLALSALPTSGPGMLPDQSTPGTPGATPDLTVQPAGADQVQDQGSNFSINPANPPGGKMDLLSEAENWVKKEKTPLLVVGGAVLLWKLFIGKKSVFKLLK